MFAVPLSAGDVLARLGLFVGAATFSFVAVAEMLSLTESLFWTAMAGVGVATSALMVSRRWESSRVPAAGALMGAVLPTLVITGAVVARAFG